MTTATQIREREVGATIARIRIAVTYDPRLLRRMVIHAALIAAGLLGVAVGCGWVLAG
ncbi:MAG TPA: hypothetical protein VF212_01605 [Longimicrobiales bacterium]